MNSLDDPTQRHCRECGHRTDVPRADCDCQQCQRNKPLDAVGVLVQVGSEVQFDPQGSVTTGRVVSLFWHPVGVSARVQYAPGLEFPIVCRRLHVVSPPMAPDTGSVMLVASQRVSDD